jgi:hypothetical protein
VNFTGLQVVTSQKVEFFIDTVMRISDITENLVFLCPEYLILCAICHTYNVYIWKEILFVQFGEILFSVELLDF